MLKDIFNGLFYFGMFFLLMPIWPLVLPFWGLGFLIRKLKGASDAPYLKEQLNG